MKVGPCISAASASSDRNASKTGRRATVAASGSTPPVNAFDSVMMSGTIAGGLTCEQRAGAAEAGEDLVGDQQQTMAIGGRAQAAQGRGVVEDHAARPLHQRLDDDRGDVRCLAREQHVEPRRARLIARQIGDELIGQKTAAAAVHAGRGIADRHRAAVSP